MIPVVCVGFHVAPPSSDKAYVLGKSFPPFCKLWCQQVPSSRPFGEFDHPGFPGAGICFRETEHGGVPPALSLIVTPHHHDLAAVHDQIQVRTCLGANSKPASGLAA